MFLHDKCFVCLNESLIMLVLYVIIFRTHGHHCDLTTFPLSFNLFPDDKISIYIYRERVRKRETERERSFSSSLSILDFFLV